MITNPSFVSEGAQDKKLPFQGSVVYLITELGTLVALLYDLGKGQVVNVSTADFLKKLVCYKIKRIQITQSVVSEEPEPVSRMTLAMLLEHDCVCVVDVRQEVPLA